MSKKKAIYICLAAVAVIAIGLVVFALIRTSDTNKYNNYFNDAKQYYQSGDYKSAITYLEKAVSLKSTDESVLMLADCYIAENETDKAMALLTKYADKSSAVKQRLEELKKGGASGSGAVIGTETFKADTTSVGLSGKGLKSADIAQLSKLTELQSATLSKNSLTDISVLSGLSKLEVLDLSDNQITDITPLKSLASLRTLYLDNNKITDFTPLYGLKKLTTLSIKGMDITEKQLGEIKSALPNCRVHSEQASEDVEDVTIGGTTFKSNVTSLDLGNKKISDVSPLSACDGLEKLDLRWNSIRDISALRDIPALKWLCIKNNSISDLRPLMGLTRLTYLDAQNNAFSAVSSVASIGSLQYLYLGGNKISSFSTLSECTNLVELGLENTGLTDADLKSLTGLTKLAKLYLEDNPAITQTGVDSLQAALPNCKISHSELKQEIKLGSKTFAADAAVVDASGLGIEDISAASKLTACTTLLLGGNSISSIAAITGLTSVSTLDLSNNYISDISQLPSMKGLRSLNLKGNPISDASPLLTMTWLKELYISGSGLSKDQIASLYSALRGCSITVDGYTP